VNGSTFENLKQGGDPMLVLYLNQGNGKFSDVTPPKRPRQKGLGNGRLCGGL